MFAALHETVGKIFALKAMDRYLLFTRQLVADVQREVAFQSHLDGLEGFSPRLFNVTQDSTYTYLVMEFIPGGTLERLCKTVRQPMAEDVARFYVAEIACGLALLHSLHFVHGDIKPRNVMIDALGHIKLVDFGTARNLHYNPLERCFTPIRREGAWLTTDFAAPELLQDLPYTTGVDWYSLGALAAALVTGHPPPSMVSRRTGKLQDTRVMDRWLGSLTVTTSLRGLLHGLLAADPLRRYKFDDISSHEWMKGVDWSHVRARRCWPPFIPSLRFRADLRYFASTTPRRPGGKLVPRSFAARYTDASMFTIRTSSPVPVLSDTRNEPDVRASQGPERTTSRVAVQHPCPRGEPDDDDDDPHLRQTPSPSTLAIVRQLVPRAVSPATERTRRVMPLVLLSGV